MSNRTYAEEIITPTLAAQYLERNKHNRPLKNRSIQEYTQSMKAGMWRSNGEAIKFDTDGNLLDGQNRLWAVIESGIPVTMLVARGIESGAQETMDTGAKRSLPDILKLRGESNWVSLSAVIRALYYWDNRSERGRTVLGSSGQAPVSNSALLNYFDDKDPEFIRQLTKECDRLRGYRRCHIPASVSAPLIREMMLIDPDDYLCFTEHIRTGTPAFHELGEDDPILRLLTNMDIRQSQKHYYNPTETGALFVKAWNAFRDGVPVKVLRWRRGGASPELFPAIH